VTSDPFAMFDGAYVMGALSDSDRRAYEGHLTVCDECSAALRDLRDLPGLLATVPESALVEDIPPPRSLLPALQRRMRRDANRRRWIMGGVAAAAAACLVTVAVLVSQPDGGAPARQPVAMSALPNVNTPLIATADVRDVGWGTRIEVVCHYDENEPTRPYGLRVIDRTGRSHELGTWNLAPGKVATYRSGTALRRAQISAVEITTVDGKALLMLRL